MALVVTGFTGDFVPVGIKTRIAMYAAEQGLDGREAILYHPRLGGPWTDHIHHVDYETIRAIQLPADTTRKSGRAEAKYRVITSDSTERYQYQLDEYPDDGVLAWVHVSDLPVPAYLIASVAGSYKVALLTQRSEKSFRRNHPDVPHFSDWFVDRWTP